MSASTKQATVAKFRTVDVIDYLVTALVRPQVSDGGKIVAARDTAHALARTGLLSLYS